MKKVFILFFLLFISVNTYSQSFGFRIGKENKVLKIPFEIKNNFIIVRLTFNQSLPLKFIFDTGAEHTILSKRLYADILGLTYDRSVRLVGADMSQELIAYVSRKVHLQAGDAIAPTQDILILADDYFLIDGYVGEEIHGIIGADLFKNLTLTIDFKKGQLIFQRSSNYKKPSKKWTEVPILLDQNKPYLLATADYEGKKVPLKLLVDTGASLSLLLHTDTHPDLALPENFIKGRVGQGLGGSLDGFLGRVKRLEFEKFYFNDVITNYQDVTVMLDTLITPSRNGIFGNALIQRFQVTIDYPKEKMYLRPIRKYNKALSYDKSGLELIASGVKLRTILVQNVIPNSPAAKAGLQKGDVIRRINGVNSKLLDLRLITNKLQKKVGKKIRLTILRNGKKIKVNFKLRDLI